MKFTHCKPKQLPSLEVKTSDKGRFYTLPSGNVASSVTTITGYDKKDSLEEWRKRVGEEEANRVSRIATSRGTRTHKLCEDYLDNNPNFAFKAMPDSLSFFKQIKQFLDKIDNIHYMEDALYSEKYRIAGRVDCIAEYDGVLSVIDFKTSSKEKEKHHIHNYFQQATAYSVMYEELIGKQIDQIIIIIAVENGHPQVFIESAANWKQSLFDTIKSYYEQSINTSSL